MLDADAQIIALDPVGVWWGLRLAADGKQPGFAIPVFGGLHGDVPLEPTAGKLIADLVVDRGISVVLDVSQFEHDSDKSRFVTDFMSRFFFRKKAAPSAVHLFLEECQEFIPQNMQRGEEHMLHASQRMIRLGRNFGIGATLISQRPQDVNKKALNQAECVFAFQLTGPQERKAVDGWMSDKGLDLDLAADLPKLAVGEAHVWSPAWLRVSKVVKIAAKRTFNASSTPEVGKAATSRTLAPIDLEKLRESMASTIERAKADDPKLLQRRIRELEARLRKKPAPPAPAIDARKLEAAERQGYERATRETRSQLKALEEANRKLVARIEQASKILGAKIEVPRVDFKKSLLPIERAINVPRPEPRMMPARAPPPQVDTDQSFGRCERLILKFLALREGRQFNRSQIGAMTGYSPKGGGFNNSLSRLKVAGLIRQRGDFFEIADAIAAAEILGDEYNSPDQGALEDWLGKLPAAAKKIYKELLENPDEVFTKETLGERTGYSPDGGGFNNAISQLCTLGLAERTPEGIRFNSELLEVA